MSALIPIPARSTLGRRKFLVSMGTRARKVSGAAAGIVPAGRAAGTRICPLGLPHSHLLHPDRCPAQPGERRGSWPPLRGCGRRLLTLAQPRRWLRSAPLLPARSPPRGKLLLGEQGRAPAASASLCVGLEGPSSTGLSSLGPPHHPATGWQGLDVGRGKDLGQL